MNKSAIVQLSALLSKYVYYEDSESQLGKKETFESIEKIVPGIYKLYDSQDSEGPISEYNYRAEVWIDKINNTLFIANVGTRFSAKSTDLIISDILDDLNIMKGILPNKAESVISLNQYIIDKLAESDYSKFNFVFTGHSLGGHLASIGAANMFLKMPSAKSIMSIGFDAPGAKKSVNILYKNKGINPKDTIVQYIAVNNVNDIVNMSEDQVESCLTYKVKFEAPSWYQKVKEIDHELNPGNCYRFFINLVKCFGCTSCISSSYEKANLEKLADKLLKDGLFKTDLELFSNHRDFLEYLLADKIIEVNHVQTKLSYLLDKEVYVLYNVKLISQYMKEEDKFHNAKINDIYVDKPLMSENLRYYDKLSSQVICKIDEDPIYGYLKTPSLYGENESILHLKDHVVDI